MPRLILVCGGVAQSVEQRDHNPRVGGSIPSPATTLRSYELRVVQPQRRLLERSVPSVALGAKLGFLLYLCN